MSRSRHALPPTLKLIDTLKGVLLIALNLKEMNYNTQYPLKMLKTLFLTHLKKHNNVKTPKRGVVSATKAATYHLCERCLQLPYKNFMVVMHN